MLRKLIEILGRQKWMQPVFFAGGFLSIRLIYPLQYLLLRELICCRSVLDLGCGRHSMVPIIPYSIETTGVEMFGPHFEEAKKKGRHTHYLRADITEVEFEPKSFDAVVLLDVIEHLDHIQGERLMDKMESWARKKVIIFTPNGFLHQDDYADNPLMAHRSGWEASDFDKRGYRVRGVRGFKPFVKCEHDGERKQGILMNMFNGMSQIITYHHPRQAFQLFCVKNIV